MSTNPTPAPHKGFFAHIGDFFKRIFEDKSAWEKTASVALNVASVGLGTIATLTMGPAAAAKVQAVITKAQNALSGAEQILAGDTGGTAKQQLLELAQTTQADLKTLLADADVTNDANAAKITEELNLAIDAFQTIVDEA
jgi:hypothetical protein